MYIYVYRYIYKYINGIYTYACTCTYTIINTHTHKWVFLVNPVLLQYVLPAVPEFQSRSNFIFSRRFSFFNDPVSAA